jgi:hypothetical protein
MTKSRIISALVLFAVLGAFGAVYQFYLKEQLESYARDQELQRQLESTYADLQNFFHGYQPEIVTAAWSAQRQPWHNALLDRARYFHDGGWYEHEEPPQNVPVMRLWYGDKTNEMISEAFESISQRMQYGTFPMDFHGMFGVPHAQQWAGITPSRDRVNRALGRLSFGISALELLAEAQAARISYIVIWPPDTRARHNEMLVSRTLGLDFHMTTANLVDFLEKLRLEGRHFSVEAMRVEWPHILANTEPQLRVQMLLTQSVFREEQLMAAATAPGADTDDGEVVMAAQQPQTARQAFQFEGLDTGTTWQPPPEPNFVQRGWQWIKRNYFYMN